jgi:hypothetical protein
VLKTYHPSCRFRGERNYLHSTDLYASLLAGLESSGFGPATGGLRLTMRRVLRNAVATHYQKLDEKPVVPQDSPIEFMVEAQAGRVAGWMSETDRAVTARSPYDEVTIRSLAVIEDDSIRMGGAPPNTAFEVATAMAVALHNALLPPSPGRKWMLGRVDLGRPLEKRDAEGMIVRMMQRLGGAFTRSAIVAQGQILGHMQFSLSAAY